jgi:glutathionyl-hydroquinone reductase
MLRIKSTIYLTGQAIPKTQIQKTKTIARFDIVIWNLFGICDLEFVYYLFGDIFSLTAMPIAPFIEGALE